ncbi:MAG: hypothetical protein J1F68_04920 [Clostridiales bacterium]|nr:hypothetical protein [Clostridiales bacterium]
MFGKYTQEQVSDNQQYTQECDKIYHSFRIAEVKESRVREAAIPIFFSIFFALMIMAFVVCVVRIKVYGDMNGDTWLIFVYLYILIAAFVLSAAVWIGFALSVRLSGRDKGFHHYLYRDKNGLFYINVCVDNGQPFITRIVNCDKLIDFDGDKKDSMSSWYPYKFERYSGIKQFVVSPNAVFSDTDHSLIAYKHKLKKKVTRGNTVIYKFYGVQGLMVGARHAHCLVVKDGKIQYAVAHYMYKYPIDVGYFHRNFKHTYTHVDDDSIKIVFSREFVENAQKAKFDLPEQSVNIVYESVL